jgi:hypothetical protein
VNKTISVVRQVTDVYQQAGIAMAIEIVLMVAMNRRMCVPTLTGHVTAISSRVVMVDVLITDLSATEMMTVGIIQTNIPRLNARHVLVHQTHSPVNRTVVPVSIHAFHSMPYVMVKGNVVSVKTNNSLVLQDNASRVNFNVTMESAFQIFGSVTLTTIAVICRMKRTAHIVLVLKVNSNVTTPVVFLSRLSAMDLTIVLITPMKKNKFA